MPNYLFTPEQAARSSLAALRYLSVLPRTVRQDFSQEFVGGRGQTVNVRGPVTVDHAARVYTKANRTNRDGISFDNLTQAIYPVKLEDQAYSAVRLPDDFATFSIESMEQQVLAPQCEAVYEAVVDPLVSVMQGISPDSTIANVKADGSNVREALIDARRVLNARKVPLANRTIAVGPGIEAAILSDSQLQKVNESGSDGLLREATIARLFGFDIVSDPRLGDYYGVAYNADAFAHVTRPAMNPAGAPRSATVSQDGFALRWTQAYDAVQLEDQSVVDTFVGAAILDPNRAVSFALELVGSTIAITDDTETIGIGDTFRLEVKDASGTVIPNRLIAWTTSNAARATVDADGVVTGVATGSAATITATFQAKTDTAAITVS